MSADGSFCVRLEPTGSRGFFVFQVVVGDLTLGDADPSIVWSGVTGMGTIRTLTDARLDPKTNAPRQIFELLTSESEPDLYDATLLEFGGESMDRHVTRCYVYDDEAVLLFGIPGAAEPASIRLPADEYRAIAASAKAAVEAFDYQRP
jgi:hypothetical protein